MRSEHNREVLDWYQVTDLDSGYLDRLILMNEEPVKKGYTANSKVREGDPRDSHTVAASP